MLFLISINLKQFLKTQIQIKLSYHYKPNNNNNINNSNLFHYNNKSLNNTNKIMMRCKIDLLCLNEVNLYIIYIYI